MFLENGSLISCGHQRVSDPTITDKGGRLGVCPVPLTGYRRSSLCQPGAFSSCSSDYLAPSLWGLEVLSGKSLSPLPQEGSELSSSLPFVKPETSPPFVFLLPKFCGLFLFASANFHPLWFLLFSLSS